MRHVCTDTNWAVSEFADAELGDERRTRPLVDLANVLGQHPTAALPEACGDGGMLKAARIGKLSGILVPVSVGAPRRSPPAWTLHRLDVPLPAPAGQRAGEVWGASPGCSGGEGLGTGGGGRQGRNDGTRKCPGSARTSPPKPRHGSWTSRTQRVLGEHGPGQSEGERTPAGDAARYA